MKDASASQEHHQRKREVVEQYAQERVNKKIENLTHLGSPLVLSEKLAERLMQLDSVNMNDVLRYYAELNNRHTIKTKLLEVVEDMLNQ
jgi:hypothetical protein